VAFLVADWPHRLFVGPETPGALQLFARMPGAFNATERAHGLRFAAHASMALKVAMSQEQHAENPQAAMASREVTGRPKAS
jgi:hypothetical protein